MGGDSGLCNMHFYPEEYVKGKHWAWISGVLEPLKKLVAEDGTPSAVSHRILITQTLTGHCKGKDKAVSGSYSTAALRHIVLLPEWVPSFISTGAAHTKRRERPLLAKEGTIPGI